MCNPRRIQVRATRQLAEAWDQEVRRRVVLSGEASGEARVRERLAATVGAPTLAALARVLARTEGWQEGEDGVFRHRLDGGVISFDPDSRELEIVARVSARVEASGEAVTIVRAEVGDLLRASGTGTYYDDEWGGHTRERAERTADLAAESALDDAAERARTRERERAESAHAQDVREQARRNAEDSLAATRRKRERELRAQAADVLAAIGETGRGLFHRALAEAYRDAILAYARTHGATGVSCAEGADGVVDIQFELEV
ncbi:molecular chaperone DnaJ [Actinomadura graeca]|uniref:Molecular chaperone DnaJ n=2 Tax=Actinomadura graeca TaxID=2750812 RepID=A0ABX8R722_9ACTN|nr:molecular chaperone DnaJ [Actinomadura graeca]